MNRQRTEASSLFLVQGFSSVITWPLNIKEEGKPKKQNRTGSIRRKISSRPHSCSMEPKNIHNTVIGREWPLVGFMAPPADVAP